MASTSRASASSRNEQGCSFGLRGPLADSFAIVVETKFDSDALELAGDMALHFIDLGGSGVRDLAAFATTF